MLSLAVLAASAALVTVSPQSDRKAFEIGPDRIGAQGPVDVLVARTSFANDADPAASRHDEERLRGELANLDRYLRWQTYGQVQIGRVEFSAIVPLADSTAYAFRKDERSGRDARDRVMAQDMLAWLRANRDEDPLDEFDTIFLLINETPKEVRLSTGAAAQSVLGGRGVTFFGALPRWRVMAHELGHNFGYSHARAVLDRSGKAIVPDPDQARFVTYGDPFSPMGRGSSSYSVVEKVRKGWIGKDDSSDRWVEEAEDADHTVVAYDLPDAEGLVGLYLEHDLGLAETKPKQRRRKGKVVTETVSTENQRVWLAMSAFGPFDGEAPERAKEPRLLVHVTGLEGTKGRQGVHCILDTSPGTLTPEAAGKRPLQELADTGLRRGERIQLVDKSGAKVTIEFRRYDRKRDAATVRVRRSPGRAR